MKRIIVSILIIAVTFACKDNKTATENKVEKAKPAVEQTRDANTDNIRFVLFESDYNPQQTYIKMKEYLEQEGMFYPHLVDHQTAAKNSNIELKPIYLMVFGNPKMGGFLMQENPEVAIELPLKALIYEDAEGKTWVMYKDMNYLKSLYFLKDPNQVIQKMNALQAGFKKAVVNPIHTSQIKDEELK